MDAESQLCASRDKLLDFDGDFGMGMSMAVMVVGGKRGRPRSNVTLSGLLNVLDGVGSEEGKIFFATVCILSSIS